MNRRGFLVALLASGSAPLLAACSRFSGVKDDGPLGISLEDWRDRLGEHAYAVLFEEATERAYSSPLNDEKQDGTFVCAACQNPLFESDAKYDSGTGWPSFWRSIEGTLDTRTDFQLVMPRTEYHCAHCGGHQGHVFNDGPNPTGKRYCNNGVSLWFVPEADPLPKRVERGIS